MAQTLERILPFSKHLLERALSPGDVAIDGTAGNGQNSGEGGGLNRGASLYPEIQQKNYCGQIRRQRHEQ